MEKIIVTERLYARELTCNDFDDLSEIFRDKEVMCAWEHTFSDEETEEWIEKNIKRYKNDKTAYFAVINKKNGIFVGQVGLNYSFVNNKKILELGYIIKKKYWNYGYAYEASCAFIKLAFDKMQENEVYALIRPENIYSVNLALKLGFVKISSYIKNYKGKNMIHDIYILKKSNKN